MKKRKNIRKKTVSMTLSLVMAMSLIPAINKPSTAEAATSDTASTTTFATKDELIADTFNLENGIVQNVSFGSKSNQTWYIAGYDSNANNLVLMCDPDKPLISSLTFSYSYPNPTFPLSDNQGLSIDTCTYTEQTPSIIGMNHYGLSQLRAELKKKETDTTLFTSAEQELMEYTTIYNYDKKNSCYYSTTDKLYAAQGYQDSTGNSYLVVGKNSLLFPNKGLKIQLTNTSGNPYYGNSNSFWLRTPGASDNTTVASKENFYSYFSYKSAFGSSYAAVPAFALDVSSVFFASAIPVKTACRQNSFSGSTSLIFRLDDNNYGNIKSTIDYTETGVRITKNEGDADKLYLCAQGQDADGTEWYYSDIISETTTIDYSTIHTGADEASCKIWIETTKDNVTYAQMAETIGTPRASVVDGTYTANQNVTLSTRTEGATIHYTTDGSEPDETSTIYTEPISVTGKIGETIATTIKAITITDDDERSRVMTYTYIIKLSHTHNFNPAWASDSGSHWHECNAPNCTITNNTQKSGYAAHTEDSGTVTKEPTATDTGIKTYKCSVCGYVIRTETLPATGNTTPAAQNTTLTVDSENCKVKVTSSSTTNPTVEYIASTNSKATTIKIPDTVTVDGITYKVTNIAANAFANNKKITKVTIGKNVTSIGKNTFKNCKKLKTVSMGTNITTINDSAFYKCTALTKITIPSKVNKIGKQAFYGCKKLKSITIKTTKLTNKKVGSKAFKGIYAKATIKVPGRKLSNYKKMLKAKGVSSKAKIKK